MINVLRSTHLRRVAILSTIACTAFAPLWALADTNPILAMANRLHVPKTGSAQQDKARGITLLEYVPQGETVDNWTRLFSVTAYHTATTDLGIRSAIAKYGAGIVAHHGTIKKTTFASGGKIATFNEFSYPGERDASILFSPSPGLLIIESLSSRGSDQITESDKNALRTEAKI